MLFLVSFIISCFVASQCEAVSYVTPCRASDKPCLISSADAVLKRICNGVPEFDMPVVDPLYIESVRSDNDDLKMEFKNVNIHGVSKCKFLDVSRDLKKQTVTIVVTCPLMSNGQYSMKGKILFFDIFGDGDYEIITKNTTITLTQKMKTITGADGKPHWKTTSFDYTYELYDEVTLHMHNLFNGDESRAKPILEVFNNSAKELLAELGGPIYKEVLNKAISIINKLFANVPVDMLEIE